MTKLKVAVLFGAPSPEHDVSIITGRIALEKIDREKYDAFPIYFSREGKTFLGNTESDTPPCRLQLDGFVGDAEQLKSWREIIIPADFSSGDLLIFDGEKFTRQKEIIDVAILAFHGAFGEDGCVAGLLELAGIPYAGAPVVAAAASMDKLLSKKIFRDLGVPVVDHLHFFRDEWQKNSEEIKKRIAKELKFPVFVKPGNLGSSIGVSRVNTPEGLDYAVSVACEFDSLVIVETGLVDAMEVNCALLGWRDPIVSLLEQPLSAKDFLSFEEKYLTKGGTIKGGGKAKCIVPAPLGEKLTQEIQAAAKKIFLALGCCGVARIDFFADHRRGKFWANEINTPPGTFQIGLWEKCGISAREVFDRLIADALARHAENAQNQRVFETVLLKK